MSSDPAASTLRSLVLEDDPILRERILLPGLRRVDGCGTGAELQQRLQREGAEMVVLDVGLPDTAGFTLARVLRQHRPDLGIVMLTSLAQTEDRIRGWSRFSARILLVRQAAVNCNRRFSEASGMHCRSVS